MLETGKEPETFGLFWTKFDFQIFRVDTIGSIWNVWILLLITSVGMVALLMKNADIMTNLPVPICF